MRHFQGPGKCQQTSHREGGLKWQRTDLIWRCCEQVLEIKEDVDGSPGNEN